MRRIDSIDFFYLAMPEIHDIGDGSQDALLVRVTAGSQVGWGECEAAPLVTIASLVCPMSHSACKPVAASVLGEKIEDVADIERIHHQVRRNSMDLLQADHALSGIDIALWDLLGNAAQRPVFEMLGFPQAFPKLPYCSLLFGDTPEETRQKAREAREQGFRAVKFGWGNFGRQDLRADEDQVVAAREGVGKDGILSIDAGAVWERDIEEAARRIKVLEECNVTWLEEPFHHGAYSEYSALSRRCKRLKLAGGEGAHNELMVQQMIDATGIGFIQIDSGRVGGITAAKRAFDYARTRGVAFINHTFTSHLALSASLQPYAGAAEHTLCEYPGQLTPLGYEMTSEHLELNANGEILLPGRPGLGISPNLTAVAKYLVDARIVVGGQVLYETPAVYT